MKKNLLVFATVFVLGLILGTLGTISFPVGVNITYFWPAAAIQAVSGIFFGVWGILGGIAFPVLSNALTDGTYAHTLGFIPSNVIQCALPAIAVRIYRKMLDFSKFKNIILFIIVCTIVPNVLGSIVGCGILYELGNIRAQTEFWSLVLAWIVGNVPCSAIFGFLLVKTLTPVLKDCALYYEGYIK